MSGFSVMSKSRGWLHQVPITEGRVPLVVGEVSGHGCQPLTGVAVSAVSTASPMVSGPPWVTHSQ